jgi:hypothetical protein
MIKSNIQMHHETNKLYPVIEGHEGKIFQAAARAPMATADIVDAIL